MFGGFKGNQQITTTLFLLFSFWGGSQKQTLPSGIPYLSLFLKACCLGDLIGVYCLGSYSLEQGLCKIVRNHVGRTSQRVLEGTLFWSVFTKRTSTFFARGSRMFTQTMRNLRVALWAPSKAQLHRLKRGISRRLHPRKLEDMQRPGVKHPKLGQNQNLV